MEKQNGWLTLFLVLVAGGFYWSIWFVVSRLARLKWPNFGKRKKPVDPDNFLVNLMVLVLVSPALWFMWLMIRVSPAMGVASIIIIAIIVSIVVAFFVHD